MHDPFVRDTLLYGILGTVTLAGLAFTVRHMRQSYWKKLRASGDPRAKEREMMRQRRQRRST